jgi:hypothetical protein
MNQQQTERKVNQLESIVLVIALFLTMLFITITVVIGRMHEKLVKLEQTCGVTK